MKRILVTGFGPFPGMPSNPSAALAKRIAADKRLARYQIEVDTRLLPTAWSAVDAVVPQLCKEPYDAIILLGVAGRRRGISIETRAINRCTQYPDAAGKRAKSLLIGAGEGFARKARAPVARLVQAGKASGFRTAPSINAGRYLCNYVYWKVLGASPARTPCVFIHVPKLSKRTFPACVSALVAISGLIAR